MPVNPMQRRMKNSFLLGFLLAVVIMALVVAALIFKMKSIQDEKDKIVAMQKSVFVAAEDLESGESITIDSLVMQKVQTTVDFAEIVTEDDFSFMENGEIVIKYNKDGSIREKEMIMKIDVPAGTIVTKDMIAESASEIADDLRVQEFNMIVLSSELEAGDYIDVRYSIPQGQSYIVLAKKKVLKATETSIWLELSEEEILTLNNAIVESYYLTGSMLSTYVYPHPGIQEAAEVTYPVNSYVLELIRSNPNIIDEAKNALYARYNANESAIWNQRLNVLDPNAAANSSGMAEDIEAKNQEEVSKIQAAREEYISTLDGAIE